MPLGIAQSIFKNNTYIDVSTYNSIGYWSQTSLKQAGYQRNLRFDHDGTYPATYFYDYLPEYDNSAGQLDGIITNNKTHDSTGPYFLGVTASVWFRGFPSNVMSNSILYAEGSKPGSNVGLDFSIQINTSGITSGANVSTFSANPANFSDLYLDGKWHHIWIQWRGRANDITKNRIYIDGKDITTNPTAGQVPVGGEEMNNYGPRHHIGGAAGHGTNDMSVNSQHTLDMADLWVRYADETDYIPNRHWWYNDGYVNLGSDGTASGAPQPTLFVRVDNNDPDWASSETHIIQTGVGNVKYIVNGGYMTGGSFNDAGFIPSSPFEYNEAMGGQITVYKSSGPRYLI